MDTVRTLIVGAGISGLATAAALQEKSDSDYLVLEADSEIGGFCKTVKKEGFVWDYSGHFFHFKHPDIEAWLRARMVGQNIRTVQKLSHIDYHGTKVDFPFQKNIHQLPKEDFIDCLHDLYFAQSDGNETNFKDMLYGRFGRAISEKFLIPYNEKLYACDLSTLDKDAMGRFFPHANVAEIVANMKVANNQSYNATFTYPEGGAIEYVKALASAVKPDALCLSETLTKVDLQQKLAHTSRRQIRFARLVSSVPFNQLAKLCELPHDASVFNWNKVLVFNLGFDSKGPGNVHWVYYPDRSLSFYRVGFYDNIFDSSRMSLYVELGFPKDAHIDVPALREKVLEDLRRAKVITHQKLVAEHAVVMNPAYVHIHKGSTAEHQRLSAILSKSGVHSIGRYGGWTYCSIEDNIVEARALVSSWAAM